MAFVALAWWWRPESLGIMAKEFERRVFRLGDIAPRDTLLALAGILLLEALALGWRNSSVARLVRASRSARADLLIAGVNALGWWPLVLTFFSAGWIWVIEAFTRHYAALNLLGSLGPVWLQFLIVLLVTDFSGYWTHRLSHDFDFLWESHKYHHAATEFTILTGPRNHALEGLFQHLVASIPLAALGVPIKQYVGARAVIYAIELLHHSMAPWTYGWVGQWLIYSPVGHRIHHSPRADQHTSNYGNMLVIWDRLFGTWYAGDDVNETIGLPHNPYNRQGVVVEYLHTVARTARALRTSLRTGRWRTGPGTVKG
jgi:sterol desaturase/sphingolipid hydroxylase (fatty acid hydroxylase superfamily)